MTNPNELYIESELVPAPETIAMTYQVNDLSKLSDRQSTFSNTLKLPKEATVKRLLGYSDSDAFTQTQPYDLQRADLSQHGIQVIRNGRIQQLRVTDTAFECQLTHGLIGFLDLLKKSTYSELGELLDTSDVKLKDLDWSDIPNFNWDMATVMASQAAQNPLFPIIDYGGTLDTSSDINWTYIRPGVYYRQILDRIQRYTGYTFLGGKQYTDGFIDFMPFSANEFFDYQGTDWYATHLAVSVINNLPDIAVKDFLADYMRRYFLTPVVDNYEKTITFKSFDNLYENIGNAKDWTKKFVRGGREDSFTMGNYAQQNFLLWKEDSQSKYIFHPQNGNFTVDNRNLDVSIDLMKSIYAASDYGTFTGGHNIAIIRKYDTSPLPTSQVPPGIDTEVRVVRIKSVSGAVRFVGLDNTPQILFTGFKIGEFKSWQYQIDNYGQGLLKLLAKCRQIIRYVNLTPLDLQNFDFFTPVFDSNDGKYYYVNTIANFIPGRTTKVTLIRM